VLRAARWPANNRAPSAREALTVHALPPRQAETIVLTRFV